MQQQEPLQPICRSPVVAPNGRIHAQYELTRAELVVADIDIALAPRAM